MTSFNDTSSDLQIWNNAAFDCTDSIDVSASITNSCSTLKENHNINLLKNELEFEQIDKEIENVENEIDRLSQRLLKLKRDRNAERLKKLEDSMAFRCTESMSHERKGLTLGQSEIISASTMTKRMIKKMDSSATPLTQNRKLCFWKLDQIDELKMTKERGGGGGNGKRFSLSPRSTKTIPKLAKQAATTIGSRKTLSKVNVKETTSVLQPKKLFEEPPVVKTGRIVASKYNLGLRKRSLPEENEESKGNEKKRVSLEVKSSLNLVEQKCNRVKKRWEIPTEVVVFNSCIVADDDDDDGDDRTSSLCVFCEDGEQVCHGLTFADD